MANQNTSPSIKLVQTRLPKSAYSKLVKKMKAAGDVSVAAYVRRVLIQHVEGAS